MTKYVIYTLRYKNTHQKEGRIRFHSMTGFYLNGYIKLQVTAPLEAVIKVEIIELILHIINTSEFYAQ